MIEVSVDTSNLDPLSKMGNRELSTWRGVKNKSLRARHITDGSILIDKKHVENQELFNKLKERKSDKTIENDEIKLLVSDLKSEKQWVANIRGQTTSIPGMQVNGKWIALVGFRNYKHHRFFNGQHIHIANQLVEGSVDLKIGKEGILTWWKYGVPIIAVASYNAYKPNVKK